MDSIEDVEGWYLEGWVEGEPALRHYRLDTLPARIGRRSRLQIHIELPHISSEHAEIYARNGVLWLRDLGSRNGTFLNGKRVTDDRRLARGDIIQFGGSEFEISRAPETDSLPDQSTTLTLAAVPTALTTGRLSYARALHELLSRRQVSVLFQPIVDLRDRSQSHFEILGRSNHPTLPTSASALFSIAEDAGAAGELSELFCDEGMQAAAALPSGVGLFLNIHPEELVQERLIKALWCVRERHPARAITLEVHEASITDPMMMRDLRSELQALNIALAYDDFGAGRARLLEIAEAPPDFLKFDISLIRQLDTAPPARRRLVTSLVETVREMNVLCVAEGIEQLGELTACADIGFDYGQGFYLGEPMPIDHWITVPNDN